MAYYGSLIAILAWQLCIFSLGNRVLAGVSTAYVNATYDYVVVGGGTAGLTVASRLSEDPSVRVAVVEAGNFYEIVTGNQSQIPADDVLYNGKDPSDTNPLVEWDFVTTPQAVSPTVFSSQNCN
jgi:choline dehydrogenase